MREAQAAKGKKRRGTLRRFSLIRLIVLLLAGLAFSCSSTTTPPVTTLDDELITAEVREKLNSEPSLRNAIISVQTSQGVVVLRGMVEDSIDRGLAESLAGRVEGVRGVRNFLEVKRQGRYPFFRRW